jgi:hypothetical protein
MEEQLREFYFNPSNPASYSSEGKLWKTLKGQPEFSSLRRSDIKHFLRKQKEYTLYKASQRKFKRRKVLVSGINAQWQADLVDMSQLAKKNKGNTFILTVIDVFSKKAYAQALKNKSAPAVREAFQKILDSNSEGQPPYKVQTDKGTEFLNSQLKTLAKDNGIKFFTAEDDATKAQIVERFNRTLKNKLYRLMHSTDGVWLTSLQKVMDGYNKTYHRSIDMAPNEVRRENEEALFQKLYPTEPELLLKDRSSRYLQGLRVGSFVRLLNKKKAFEREFKPRWTKEVFLVRLINKSAKQPLVKIKDLMGEAVLGYFYTNEIQRVEEPAFDLGKVLQYKKNMVLVSRDGYPKKFDTWITRNKLKELRRKR